MTYTLCQDDNPPQYPLTPAKQDQGRHHPLPPDSSMPQRLKRPHYFRVINNDHVCKRLSSTRTVGLGSLITAPPLYFWIGIASDRLTHAPWLKAVELGTTPLCTTLINNFSSPGVDLYIHQHHFLVLGRNLDWKETTNIETIVPEVLETSSYARC